MREPRRVLSGTCLPVRMPLVFSILLWLLLDRFAVPGWAWGIAGTLVLFIWIIWVWDVATRDNVELDLKQLPRKPGK